MKVLLVMESPVIKKHYLNTLPPLGILYLASSLESKNIPTDVVDCNVNKLDMSVLGDYDVVGFSVHSANITLSLRTAERIKKAHPEIKIVFGGPHVMSNPLFFITKRFIDAAIVGEGEHTFYEYLTGTPEKVKGLYIKRNDEIIMTESRPWIENLDSLPFPAFDKINIRKYNVPLKRGKIISSIMTSRGCPFGCIFCFHSLGKKWRYRSAKNVVDEIEWQIKEFGVDEICIEDDNMTLNIERAEEIFDLVIQRGINVKLQLHNGVRADKLSRELIRKMKRAGVWLFSVAPESGNPETLTKINKGFKLERISQAVEWARQLKLYTTSFFMVGFPWETKEDIERTIEFAKELNTDFTQFARVFPFKNTKLYDILDMEDKFGEDQGLFYDASKYSKIKEEEINRLIKKAYRSCFLKPRVIYKLFMTVSLKDLYYLARYAVTSNSI